MPGHREQKNPIDRQLKRSASAPEKARSPAGFFSSQRCSLPQGASVLGPGLNVSKPFSQWSGLAKPRLAVFRIRALRTDSLDRS